MGGTPGAKDAERNVTVVIVHGIPGWDGSNARGCPVDAIRVERVHCVRPDGSTRL